MPTFLAFQIDKLRQAALSLLSPASICSLPQLLAALAIGIGFLVWARRRRRGRVRIRVLWRALIRSRRIVFSRSTGADVFYAFVNIFAIGGLIGWGVLSAVAVSAVVVAESTCVLGIRVPSALPQWALKAGMTLGTFLGYEFGYYLDHALKHKVPVLWELHKVHHTAEHLTPFTVFRVHPLDTLSFVDLVAVTAGVAHGLVTYVAGQPVGLFMLDGSNILSILFLFLLAPLQHSQFWIPLRGLAGKLLLSPAHHQLHHSINPEHHNCNLGSCLALFDWMFGTLSVPPEKSPRLRFGVASSGDDPHRPWSLLITPITAALAVLIAPVIRRPGSRGRDRLVF